LGAFENHIQENLEGGDRKACLLSGPVLDDANDPAADFGRGPVQYPIRFWKVVPMTAPEGDGTSSRVLQVFGFVFTQAAVVKKLGIETFDPGRFERYQVPLTEIERAAGMAFDAVLHRADVLAGGQATRIDSEVELRGLRRRAA
jgi:endonuclease G